MPYCCPTKPIPRHYADRLPQRMCRNSLIAFRVHEQTRKAIFALAHEHCKSVSEYMAGLLNGHLNEVAQTEENLPLPNQERK